MRTSISAGTLIWAALLACYLQSSGGFASATSSDEPPMLSKTEDSNQQLESDMSKRDWNRNLHSWGKRAWQNLQGGWGKRDAWGNQDDKDWQFDAASKRDWNRNLHSWGKRAWQSLQGGWGKRDPWGSQYYAPASTDKRAWQNLQGGWGKRYAPDDEYTIRQLATLLEQGDQDPSQYNEYGPETDIEYNNDEKRAWKSLNGGGWGKRTENWANFRDGGSSWTNLKGMWGKRSLPDRIPQ